MMTILVDNDHVRVTGLERLSAGNSLEFKQLIKLHLTTACRVVEIDCAQIRFLDSDGLGALICIHKWIAPHGGKVRLKQPSELVRQLLGRLHLDEIFELTP